MRNRRVSCIIPLVAAWVMLFFTARAQCPQFTSSSITGNSTLLCEGATVTLSIAGQNIDPGSFVQWYINPGNNFDPYNGEGMLIGSVPVMTDPCDNPPEVLYIMVNPDNTQVGGSGDQCDEFMVLWTGSGGYATSDLLVTNLGPGTFQWNSFVAGNAGNFTCGIPLPPGPVPANAILIIQSSPNNNVFIDNSNLCAAGLPVYIISYDGTGACTGGYFDNNSPCSSCPVMIAINGATCQFNLNLDYMPPGGSVDGWGWANTGSGVFADVVPVVNVPAFVPPVSTIDDFVWTVPANFCEIQGGGEYWITGIIDPPPSGACPDIFSSYFGIEVSCPELILSGGGVVCQGNCPDNPTEIAFTIIGDDVPFEADLIVTASVFPPFPISNLPITDGQTISVCLGGFFPSFDPNSGILTVPTLAIGITATVQIVSLVSDAGCPVEVDPDFITLTFIAAPTANAGNNQTICAGEVVMLSGSIGGSAAQSTWSANGDGTFGNPLDLNTTYTPGPGDIANGQVQLTLSAMDIDGVCTPATSTMTVTIDPSLLIEVNTPLTICDNDEAFIFAMITGSNEPGMWETTGDGTFDNPNDPNTIYTPGSDDILNGTVTLTFNPVNSGVCLLSSEPLILTLVPAPEVTVPQNLEICDYESVDININVTGAFINVMWSFSGDGVLDIDNSMMVTYTPGPIDILNQFTVVSVTIQSAFAECGLLTYNIPVIITHCDCPPFLTMPPGSPLCSINGMLDLSTLIIDAGPGTWSITDEPPGFNPATIAGSLFSVNMSDPGTYEVTFTLDNPEPGCPSSISEDVMVTEPFVPVAGPDIDLCGPQAVLLNGFVVPSVGASVIWETSGDGTFSDNSSLTPTYTPGPLDSLAAGFNLSLHVMDPVCGDQADTVAILFHSSPFATFANDTITICNTSANGSILNFYSILAGGDISGTWTNQSGLPVDFSNPLSVDFDGIPVGFYPFQYRTNSATPPCVDINYTIWISVEDCLCPLLVVQNLPGGICASQASLSLNAFIMAGGPGSWQIIGTPVGSNPGTIMGSSFIINGCDPGEYFMRFTLDAAPLDGCPDSAEISVFVQEQPTLSISGDTSTCGQTAVDLNTVLGGSSTGVLWSTSGQGTFSNPSSLNPVYTPSITDVASVQINLIATLTDTFGYCIAVSDTISLFIVTPPSTTFSALTDTLCNHPDSGSVINLFDFIVQGDGTGFWTDLDGALVDLSNPALVDFDGVAPGIYRLSYTTQTALAPCTDSMYLFTVVVEDCSCPSLLIDDTGINVCQESIYDLNDEIILAAPGSWAITSGPMGGTWVQINGTQLSTAGATSGNYFITYTMTNPVAGCPASLTIPLFVESLPSFSIVTIGCDSAHTSYEVIVMTDASSLSADFGNVTTAGADGFRIASIPAGQDIIVLLSSASGLCSTIENIMAPDCNCTLLIEDISDTLRLCQGESTTLIPLVAGAQGSFISSWVTPTGTIIQPSLTISTPGQFVWIVRDSFGCEERDTFNVKFEGPVGATLTGIPPSCPEDTDGQIIIQSVDQGTPPYIIQLDVNAGVMVNQFPFLIDQVMSGNHVVTIRDNMGCQIIVPVVVDNPGFGNISIGADAEVQRGDSILITPIVESIAIEEVVWDPLTISTGVAPFWYAPLSNIVITITVTDSAGCIYEDDIMITIVDKETFYIPNIFSPNGDQINDEFIVSTNLAPDRLVSLEIFDRWGSLLYGQYNTSPFHWDGSSKGEDVLSGVYVYKLTWKDDSGNLKFRVGDISVLR